MTSLGVVIVSWNVRALLERCLASLLDELDALDIAARVIVVDNASHDGSAEMLRARFKRVALIAREDNPGFARSNNSAMRALGFDPDSPDPSDDDFVLLLNPDTEVQRGAICKLLDAMRQYPDAAVVTSRLWYADRTFQHSAFRFPGLAQLYIDLFPVPARLYESRLNGRYPRAWYDAGHVFAIDHPLGAVMLLRGQATRQVGLFDEDFELYCEEIDWCARFVERGWRNYCVSSAHVIHHAGQSTSQVKMESFIKLWTARHRLHRKHPHFAPMGIARRIVRAGMRRRMRGASKEMKEACEKIIAIWNEELRM
jgi:GT2 family glycosyltransferase